MAMTIRPLPLGTGSNLDISDTSAGDSAAVSLINAYVDRAGAFRAVPGKVQYADLGVNADVWSFYSVQFGVLLIVCNGQVWAQYAKEGALTQLTGVSLTAGEVPTFAEDSATIFFAANSRINAFVSGTTAVSIITTGPINVTSLAYIGGYLKARGDSAVDNVLGDTHYSDDKNNGYAAWEVYNNESRADALQALVVAYEQIYNVGRTTLEVSYIDGTVPFSVNKNAAQHFGTMARYSVAFDGESIYYLAEVTESRKVIHLQGGGAPSIISFPVDIPLERFERVDDARGFILAFAGQNGYALTFPTANTDIDEQPYSAITLFYHLQRKEWLILGKWDAATATYGAYGGVSFTYAEPWGLRLIGGSDGKLYQMRESEYTDYETEYSILHRWRDNGRREWKPYRTISTGKLGEYRNSPLRRGPYGSYYRRQHELVYVDYSDGGEIFRAAIRSGNVSYGTTAKGKRNILYHYNIERGKGRFVLNGIEEEFDMLRS
jgi:hypothetical protein